jgi:hypothetical protein
MNEGASSFFTSRPVPSQKPSILRTVEREIERLRELAGERHEAARAAREKARIAVLEAERAEAQARIVERAMGGVRQAHDAAVRGQSDEAERRLDEALELLATQRRT